VWVPVLTFVFAAATPGHLPLVTTAAVERLKLPPAGAPYTLERDALGARLNLRPAHPLAPPPQGLQSTLCHLAPETSAVRWTLQCRTRQLDAFLAEGAQELTVVELRGIPWHPGDDGVPARHYPPEEMDLGGPCPGTTAVGRAECLWIDGKRAEAQALFEKALPEDGLGFAALRLGDLALEIGDVEGAVAFYQQAGIGTQWGILASERLSELNGTPWQSPVPLDALMSPLQSELELRLARRQAFEGEVQGAARALWAAGTFEGCRDNVRLCRRILVEALRHPNGDPFELLALYLRVPGREQDPFAVEMAEAAGEVAAAAGASRFAANVRTSVFAKVPSDARGAYLCRTAELYLQGNDPSHADAIYEYAQSRGMAKRDRGWRAVRRRLEMSFAARRAPPASTVAAKAADIAAELAAATEALQAARQPKGRQNSDPAEAQPLH